MTRSLRSDRARTQLKRYVATMLQPSSVATYTARSLRSDRARTQSPSLRSLLNPHRNAFRFVSIGVSVEILRRKQVGLFLVCFYSLHSDLSDLHSPHSDLSDFWTKTSKTRINSFVCSYSPLPPSLCSPSNLDRTALVSSQLELPLKLYDKKTRKDLFSCMDSN
ncbi:hypothetical protein IGI04_035895 [Brassica rapa subsp. trilocularis]|uniref:Uncharacterized protein n=1 Tax=Brassica rapa subsp. trilocularis TaxID=1813537 RepID=A0ABQ7LES7_BRACM|nr:hypothetical protein IGI04_035895 [Brassica rapa subsp. trilocularis]